MVTPQQVVDEYKDFGDRCSALTGDKYPDARGYIIGGMASEIARLRNDVAKALNEDPLEDL